MRFTKALSVISVLPVLTAQVSYALLGYDTVMPTKQSPEGYHHFGRGHCLDETGQVYSSGILFYGENTDHTAFEDAVAACPLEGLVGVEDEMYSDGAKKYCRCLYTVGVFVNGVPEGTFEQDMFDFAGEGAVTSTTEEEAYAQCYKKGEDEVFEDRDEFYIQEDIDMNSFLDDGSQGEIGPFQIMLYHEPSYKWQGTTSRRSWCIDCSGNSWMFWHQSSSDCKEGDEIQVQECDAEDEQQWWVYDSGKFRSYTDMDLCWDYKKSDYTLESCGSSSTQVFGSGGDEQPHADSFNVNGNFPDQRFELYPEQKPSRCVTQHHHPRKGEKLTSAYCTTARRTVTSYWVATAPPDWTGHSLDG